MRNHRRSLLVAVGVITLIAGIAIGVWRIKPNPVSAPADWVFELSFPDAKGQPVLLSSVRGEGLTLVNFWATWCPPCVEEMPELSQFHTQMSSKGIKVIGLAVDSPSNVREFLSTRSYSYPLLITGGAGTELAKRMGNAIDALPYTVLIDEKNRIIKQKAGRIREEELKSWISEVR
jgi:thiol-disulfide isomerase/thioredoxin